MRRHSIVGAIALSTLASLAVAPPAVAGTYTVTQCDSTFGVGAPDAQSFDQTAADRYREQDFCLNEANGGGLLTFHPADAGAVQGGVAGGWTFSPPPATRFIGIEATASGSQGAGDDYFPELFAFPVFPAPFISDPPQSFANPIGGERTYRWDPSQVGDGSGFTAQVRCPRIPTAPNCQGGDGNFLNVRRINLTLADSESPQVTNSASNLAGAVSQRGTLNADFAASDSGAGIREVSFAVNGAKAGEAASSCSVTSGRAIRLAPCPLSVSGSIPLDTTNPPWQQGLNQTSVCALEWADSGATSRCVAGPDVRVDNECVINNANGVAGFEQLRFEGGKAGDGRANYGADVRLTGRAVDSADRPVAGAGLCLGERLDLGSYTEESVVRMPETDRKGRFAVGIPSGPSRVFRIAQWQSATNVVEQFASLAVKAKPRLVVRPKGRIREGKKTRLRVKVNEPVAAGQTVEIQAQAPTGYVALPQCSGPVDADGRLTCSDRLPEQPGPAAYTVRYRAVVPHVDGSAYLPGESKPVTKRVKG